MKNKIRNSRKLLNGYYNYLFNGNASEEAIDLFIQQEFKHRHESNGNEDDECKICGYDIRCSIHKSW